MPCLMFSLNPREHSVHTLSARECDLVKRMGSVPPGMPFLKISASFSLSGSLSA